MEESQKHCADWKRLYPKGFTVWGSIYRTVLKRQKCECRRRSSGCQRWGAGIYDWPRGGWRNLVRWQKWLLSLVVAAIPLHTFAKIAKIAKIRRTVCLEKDGFYCIVLCITLYHSISFNVSQLITNIPWLEKNNVTEGGGDIKPSSSVTEGKSRSRPYSARSKQTSGESGSGMS